MVRDYLDNLFIRRQVIFWSISKVKRVDLHIGLKGRPFKPKLRQL